jgi:hypothetical protein
VVELVLAEVEPAHQRADGAGARVQRHERAFDLGQLGHAPLVLGTLHQPHHGAAADLHLRPAFGQAGGDRPQAGAGDGDRSPDCSTATTFDGDASVTTAARRSSLSGWSASASATRASSAAGSRPAGRRRPPAAVDLAALEVQQPRRSAR